MNNCPVTACAPCSPAASRAKLPVKGMVMTCTPPVTLKKVAFWTHGLLEEYAGTACASVGPVLPVEPAGINVMA